MKVEYTLIVAQVKGTDFSHPGIIIVDSSSIYNMMSIDFTRKLDFL